jgi:hypothetical protein
LPKHHFRKPAGKVAKPEQAEEVRLRRQQPDTERYLLQIDRQTKQSFTTLEAAQAREHVACWPHIHDSESKSRTVIDMPKST